MKIFVTEGGREKEIQDFVVEKTHLNFTAFTVVPVNSIPKNASGKTLYSELPQ